MVAFRSLPTGILLALALVPAASLAQEATFHDNSAKTLEDVVKHYAFIFQAGGVFLTEQDQKDIVAYLKLLQ